MELKEGITVLICTLNSENDLLKTLKSLMTQTLKPSQIIVASQYQNLDFKTITTKYFKYGEGDYFYYKNMKAKWTFTRKLMSLTHVFRNHFLKLSIEAVLDFKIQYIPFFIITSFYRQLGFFCKYIK